MNRHRFHIAVLREAVPHNPLVSNTAAQKRSNWKLKLALCQNFAGLALAVAIRLTFGASVWVSA